MGGIVVYYACLSVQLSLSWKIGILPGCFLHIAFFIGLLFVNGLNPVSHQSPFAHFGSWSDPGIKRQLSPTCKPVEQTNIILMINKSKRYFPSSIAIFLGQCEALTCTLVSTKIILCACDCQSKEIFQGVYRGFKGLQGFFSCFNGLQGISRDIKEKLISSAAIIAPSYNHQERHQSW